MLTLPLWGEVGNASFISPAALPRSLASPDTGSAARAAATRRHLRLRVTACHACAATHCKPHMTGLTSAGRAGRPAPCNRTRIMQFTVVEKDAPVALVRTHRRLGGPPPLLVHHAGILSVGGGMTAPWVWSLSGVLDLLRRPLCGLLDLLRSPCCRVLALDHGPHGSVFALLCGMFHRTCRVFDALFYLLGGVPYSCAPCRVGSLACLRAPRCAQRARAWRGAHTGEVYDGVSVISPKGALVKRGKLMRPSFGVLRTFEASRVPGPLSIAEVPCCPQAQSVVWGMCQSLPPS